MPLGTPIYRYFRLFSYQSNLIILQSPSRLRVIFPLHVRRLFSNCNQMSQRVISVSLITGSRFVHTKYCQNILASIYSLDHYSRGAC